MQKLEIINRETGNGFVFSYFSLLIPLFLFIAVSALASDANPVASSQNVTPLIATAYEQGAGPEDIVPQESDDEGQTAVSEEDGAIQGLNDLTVETSDEDTEEITYDIPVVVNDKVEFFIKYFQTRGRKYFEKWLARSERYLPMLKDIFRQNGLPEDLAYIALIESGFNPNAKSRARAVGMWQFMKWTGKKYGLKVD